MYITFVSYVDSLDWKDKTAQQIVDRVTSKVSEGSICLFHNAAKNTPAALPKIIEQLQSDGFNLVPVSQQIYTGEYTINHEGRQVPADTTTALPTAQSTQATTVS